ncbi:sigma-54 dependent transcriptional regulator [Paucibacter sp. B2R-40]|uniref:sigma-54-dependent transcriptional regulator n=1 Tax=Paucibacter sp. B2R-40 TaxID=2893554 RepID=UPI0021E47D9B|nr:sigma-54 dependent transcriptional regulator [Paucibacter sp. B2R-40]MCV2353874.1 sigma-54 dependent transcriptional regulator [Paucibacter sp. B2R-40]
MSASPSALPILVADDDAAVRSTLRIFLNSEGLNCELVASPAEALAALARREFGVLLADMNYSRDTTSGAEGLSLIAQANAVDPQLPIIAMTAWGTVALAVEAMRGGASDFIEKPWDNNRLASMLRNLLALRQTRQANQRLAARNQLLSAEGQSERPWIAASPAMQALMAQVERLKDAGVNLLITGENGTGKSQLAQAIHRASVRAQAPFISVNMGAIPDTLFESEMFGHEKGAFTDARQTRIGRFELADGGSLFLDEVGNIPLNQQAKLLQVLEGGQFERLGSAKPRRADVRLIAASNADLAQMVELGSFRRDLLYRLNSVQLHLPPLRERGADIVSLAEHYLASHARRYQCPAKTLGPAAREALLQHHWPGNVRELAHCMERVSLLVQHQLLQPADLGLNGTTAPVATAALDAGELTLEEAEVILIRTALKRAGGHAPQAAQALGLSRSAFYRRLEKYRL